MKKNTYYSKNQDRMLTYQNEYNELNRGRVYSKNRNRELNRKFGTPIQTDPEKNQRLADLYSEAIRKTRLEGIPYCVDHIIPASKGGLHDPDNCQIITMSDNLKKYHMSDKHLPDMRGGAGINIHIDQVLIVSSEDYLQKLKEEGNA